MRSSFLLLAALLAVPSGAVQGTEYLYVENSHSGDITVIEVGDHKVVGSIPASKVGQRPDDVVATKGGERLYVNRMAAKDVIAISTATEEVLWKVPGGGGFKPPRSLSSTGMGRNFSIWRFWKSSFSKRLMPASLGNRSISNPAKPPGRIRPTSERPVVARSPDPRLWPSSKPLARLVRHCGNTYTYLCKAA